MNKNFLYILKIYSYFLHKLHVYDYLSIFAGAAWWAETFSEWLVRQIGCKFVPLFT